MENKIVKIIKTGINGEGIGYIEKVPVFIEGALKDEVVEIEITEKRDTYKKGKVISIREKSPARVKPICHYQDRCGGCSLMICNIKNQLEIKKELVQEALIKYAQIDPRLVEDVVANPNPLQYRNQLKLPVKWLKGTLYSGMYEMNSQRLIYMEECKVHDRGLDITRMKIMGVLNEHGFRDYNDQIDRGIKNIVLRGFNGQYQCTLITGRMTIEQETIDDIMEIEGMKSLYQNTNSDRKSREMFGKIFTHLAGSKTLELKLEGIVLRLSPASFFQLNLEQAKNLYKMAVDMVEPCDTLVEAYSGVGAISLLLKDKAKKIIGIEYSKDAVNNANNNARLNHCEDRVKFVCGDAAEECTYIAKKEKVDAIVVDPPRSGLDDAMLDCILKSRAKQVLYISCNPATLAKNLSVLTELYKIERVVPFDMFSQTPHVETIVKMVRMK